MEDKKNYQKRFTPTEIQELISRYKESGKSKKAFAQENDIKYNTLMNWFEKNRVKILHWQGDGFIIYCKRLEKGTFELPETNSFGNSIEITPHQLQFILDGITLSSIKHRTRYKLRNAS